MPTTLRNGQRSFDHGHSVVDFFSSFDKRGAGVRKRFDKRRAREGGVGTRGRIAGKLALRGSGPCNDAAGTERHDKRCDAVQEALIDIQVILLTGRASEILLAAFKESI